MLAKRIVPCLDIKDGKTVKGINFVNFRDAGDPVELGAQYSREGADELVCRMYRLTRAKDFLELGKANGGPLSASLFTVGGEYQRVKDVDPFAWRAGADKVSINSAALRNPTLIEEIIRTLVDHAAWSYRR